MASMSFNAKVRESNRITIDYVVCEALDIKKGDNVTVTITKINNAGHE